MQEPIQGNGRDKVYGLASLGAENGLLSNSSRANPWVSRPIFGELPQAFNTLTLSETLKLTVPKCWIPGDHVPIRSWPLLRARSIMRGVIDPNFNLAFL